jgi:hypothetical protein
MIMENQSQSNQIKNIQQIDSEDANGQPGTIPEKDTAKNKAQDKIQEGTGIAGTDISGEDSANYKRSSDTSKSFDRDQEAINLGLDDGDLDNDISHRDSELI